MKAILIFSVFIFSVLILSLLALDHKAESCKRQQEFISKEITLISKEIDSLEKNQTFKIILDKDTLIFVKKDSAWVVKD